MPDEYEQLMRATMVDIAGTFMMDEADLIMHGFKKAPSIGSTSFWTKTLQSGQSVQLMSSFLAVPHQDHRLWDLLTPSDEAVLETCELLGLAWMPMVGVSSIVEGIEGTTASFNSCFLPHRPELARCCPYSRWAICEGTCCW